MQQNHIYTTYEIKKTPTSKKILIASLLILGIISLTTVSGIGGYLLGRNNPYQDNSNSLQVESLFEKEDVAGINTSDSTSLSTPSANITTPTTTKKPSNTTPTPTSIPKSVVITSSNNLDGYVTSTQTVSNSVEIKIGRNKYLVSRGFVSFDITKIPNNAQVQEAILRVYQVNTSGNPYSLLGKVTLDHLNFGDKLGSDDYNSPAIISGFKTLSKDSKTGWIEVEVTPQLLDDISNARSTTQFRLHFEEEVKGEDVSGDFAYFESSDNSEGSDNVPQLIIKYQ